MTVEVYDGPGTESWRSTRFAATVAGTTAYVYGRSRTTLFDTAVWDASDTVEMSWLTYGSNATTTVVLSKVSGSITSVAIYPSDTGTTSTIAGGVCTLSVPTNVRLRIEVNGDRANVMHLFEAIDLAGVVEHVTLLEFAPEMKADQVLQDKVRSLKNVDIILNAQTTEVKGDGSKVTGLQYRDRVSGDEHHVALAGIFVQIGLLPNTNWLEGAIERNRMGEIIIDAKCETNVKGVFAAGDCTTVPYKQIIIAAGEGAKASLSSFDYLIRTKTA